MIDKTIVIIQDRNINNNLWPEIIFAILYLKKINKQEYFKTSIFIDHIHINFLIYLIFIYQAFIFIYFYIKKPNIEIKKMSTKSFNKKTLKL